MKTMASIDSYIVSRATDSTKPRNEHVPVTVNKIKRYYYGDKKDALKGNSHTFIGPIIIKMPNLLSDSRGRQQANYLIYAVRNATTCLQQTAGMMHHPKIKILHL